MAEGADISEWQGDLAPDWFAQFSFVIIRAFNENGVADRTFAQNWERARGRTLRGVYGWPVPGGENVGLGARLVAVAPDAEFGWWADVERSSRGLARPDEIEYYLIGVGDRFKGFYSNISECPRTAMLDALPWWIAYYGRTNDGGRHDPHEAQPAPQREWLIHQYTSAGGLDKNWAESLPVPPKRKGMFMLVGDADGTAYVPHGGFIVGEVGIRYIGDPVELQAWVDDGYVIHQIPGASINAIPKVPGSFGAPPAGSGGQAVTGTITGTLTIP